MVSKAFRPPTVTSSRRGSASYAIEVVEAALEKGELRLRRGRSRTTMPMQALGDVLGVPEEDRPKFFDWVDTFASPFDPRVTPSLRGGRPGAMELWEYALELVEREASEPGRRRDDDDRREASDARRRDPGQRRAARQRRRREHADRARPRHARADAQPRADGVAARARRRHPAHGRAGDRADRQPVHPPRAGWPRATSSCTARRSRRASASR